MAKLKLTKSAVDTAQPQAEPVELRDTLAPGFRIGSSRLSGGDGEELRHGGMLWRVGQWYHRRRAAV